MWTPDFNPVTTAQRCMHPERLIDQEHKHKDYVPIHQHRSITGILTGAVECTILVGRTARKTGLSQVPLLQNSQRAHILDQVKGHVIHDLE
jgi:hypothetical protein